MSRTTLKTLRVGALFLGVSGFATASRADVQLSPLFGDGAVLQRDVPLQVWGTGADGEVVTVRLGRQVVQTTARDGRWIVRLAPTSATANNRELQLSATGRNMVSARVFLGEVWLCAGQSNMEIALANTLDAREVALASDDAQLRLFRVERATATQPLRDVTGSWRAASPLNTPKFSAVAYYFARELRRKLGVPVGVVVSSWSATRAEAWTSLPALQQVNARVGGIDAQLNTVDEAKRALSERQLAAWREAGSPPAPSDEGIAPEAQWAAPDLDTSDWTPFAVPGTWDADDFADGARWFRFTFDLPSDWDGQDATLHLGAIDDFDQTFLNGERVGQTGLETPRFWVTPRKYAVAGRLLRAGRNTLAVRVFDHGGNGGFVSPASELRLERGSASALDTLPAPNSAPVIATSTSISLAGTWLSKWERRVPSKPAALQPLDANAPSVLFNGMIAPLTSYSVRGFVWYQGEANVPQAWRYNALLPALIADWRRAWSQGDLPFLLVQLAPFRRKPAATNAPVTNAPAASAPVASAVTNVPANPPVTAPAETAATVETVRAETTKSSDADSAWAELREAQRQTTLSTTATAQVVILDTNPEGDLHPRRKAPVGERLALSALANVYARRADWSGPTPRALSLRDNEVRIDFDFARGLRTSDNLAPQGFALAGRDRVFFPATARIDGESVVASHPQVPFPVAVRYAWADAPLANLQNELGLPATPFRTDDFPLSTQPLDAPPPNLPVLLRFAPSPVTRPIAPPIAPSIAPSPVASSASLLAPVSSRNAEVKSLVSSRRSARAHVFRPASAAPTRRSATVETNFSGKATTLAKSVQVSRKSNPRSRP